MFIVLLTYQLLLVCVCRTNAIFFAVLDRQSRPDAEQSLARYYNRVSALLGKHRHEGYVEVRSAESTSAVVQLSVCPKVVAVVSIQSHGCMHRNSMYHLHGLCGHVTDLHEA